MATRQVDPSSPAKTLIVGGDSPIARAVCHELSQLGLPWQATSRRMANSESDLADEECAHAPIWLDQAWEDALDRLETLAFDRCLWVAGISGDAACQRDPVLARRVNVEQVARFAKLAAHRHVFVTYVSTSQVFSAAQAPASVADTPHPESLYGELKWQAEQQLQQHLPTDQLAIVRLAKVLPPHFERVGEWVRAARQGQSVHPFDDMELSPLSLAWVAEHLARLLQARVPGLQHWVGERSISYAELCRLAFNKLGLPVSLIEPCSARSAGLAPLQGATLTFAAPSGFIEAPQTLESALAPMLGALPARALASSDQ